MKRQPLATSGSAQRWKQQRFNPLAGITPQNLALFIDQFDSGYLRAAALAWEQMMERDDTLAIVTPKRRKRVSRRRWEILIGEDVPEELQAEAERHQSELKHFYSKLRVRNAVELNQSGGVRALINKVMEAPMMRFAAHEIEWRPLPTGLTATCWAVPLAFLDNTTGTLRFAGVSGNTPGEEIDPGNWLIGASETCIMKAAAVCYMLKRLSLADWLNYSEKFGLPGIHGASDAQPGSKEWQDFVNALEAFANDFIIATSKGAEIKLIEAGGTGDGPFAPMVDRMDRAMTRLFLGSDLATLSRENGTGASLQGEDADELIADDCAWVSELFNEQLDRRVIEWAFGSGVEPLAYFHLDPPIEKDTKQDIEVDKHLQTMGVAQALEDVAERYGRQMVEPGEGTTKPGKQSTPSKPSTPLQAAGANERNAFGVPAQHAALYDSFRAGLYQDLTPLRNALESLEAPGTEDELRARILTLQGHLSTLETQVLSSESANDAFETALLAEFIGGLASLGPPIAEGNASGANVFNPEQLRGPDGKWTSGGGGGGGTSPRKQTIAEVMAAIAIPGPGAEFVDYAQLDQAASLAIASRTQDPSRDLEGYYRSLSASEAKHALNRHGADPRPITHADFLNLPTLLASPVSQTWTKRPGKPDTLVTVAQHKGQITIIEEQRTGRKKLSFLTMYRP